MHNELGVIGLLDTGTRRFFDRPYQVLGADRFSRALVAAITGEQIRELPAIGAVDGFVDSTDPLGMSGFLRAAIAAALS